MADSSSTPARAPTLFQQVIANTPGKSNLEKCIQCGTCGGSCPSGPDMDHSPRTLFAMVEAGMKEDALRSNAPWYCVSCYYCTSRCPQEVHITDIMSTLKRMAIKEGHYKESSASNVPDFSGTFIDFVESYGRSFEVGLATRYYLTHRPMDMMKVAPFALGMLRRGRMDLTPNRIKNMDQLTAILKKAKEIGGSQ